MGRRAVVGHARLGKSRGPSTARSMLLPPLRPSATAPGVRHSKSQIVGFSSASRIIPHPPHSRGQPPPRPGLGGSSPSDATVAPPARTSPASTSIRFMTRVPVRPMRRIIVTRKIGWHRPASRGNRWEEPVTNEKGPEIKASGRHPTVTSGKAVTQLHLAQNRPSAQRPMALAAV